MSRAQIVKDSLQTFQVMLNFSVKVVLSWSSLCPTTATPTAPGEDLLFLGLARPTSLLPTTMCLGNGRAAEA